MLVNLHKCYTPAYTSNRELVFYNKRNDSFLFDKNDSVSIYVVPTQKVIKMRYSLCHNLVNKPIYEGEAKQLPGYIFEIKLDKVQLGAGFYDLHCEGELGLPSTELSPNIIQGFCTFGYDIENIDFEIPKPDDFALFWEDRKRELEAVALNAEFGEETVYTNEQIDCYNVTEAAFPCRYDNEGIEYDEVVSYKVSFSSTGGKRISGWLARPKKEGVYPGMIIYPGAGFHSRSRPLEHARHGYVALDIQVHGQECDGPPASFVPTRESVENDDYTRPSEHFYKDIYMHTIQALNMLTSFDFVDKDRIVAVGGSQGGRLSVTAAALDERIKAIVIAIPHFNGLSYQEWCQYANKQGLNSGEIDLKLLDTKKLNGIGYYDTANLAPYVKCPVYCGFGIKDRVSPASCVVAMYNRFASKDKTLTSLPMMGHDWDVAFDRSAWTWLKKVLNDTKQR